MGKNVAHSTVRVSNPFNSAEARKVAVIPESWETSYIFNLTQKHSL